MPKQINNADAARLLVSQFDLKGKVALALDEMIVPVIIIGDLSASAGGRRCGRNFAQGAGGATLFGFSGVAAVEGVNLLVHQITIANLVTQESSYAIKRYSAADFATIVVARNNLFAFDSPDDSNVASNVWNGLHTASTLGDPIVRVNVLGFSTEVISLDFTLFGENLTDVAGLGVVHETLNTGLHLSTIATEFVI